MSIVKSGWLHRQSTILRRWKKNWFDLWADGRLVFYDDQERRDMEDELHMRVDCINIRGSNACKDLNPPERKCCDSLLQIVCRDGRVISLCANSSDDALAWTMALQDARVNAVLAPPQMAFAQEAISSAAPPYSEFAVPPQAYNPYGEYISPLPQATQIVYSADGQPYAVAYPYQNQSQTYPYQHQGQTYPYQHQGQTYPYQHQGVYPSHQGVNHVIVQERQHNDTGDVALGMLAGAATGLAIGSLFSVF